MLHVTNGDSAVAVLRAAGMQGDILPWRDVLHEGPVREGLSLEQLSQERAAFIAEAGWGHIAEVTLAFAQRDARLRRASDEDEVVLWFEHDLYDQLQLIQVLSEIRTARITLVCEAEYLGRMKPARAARLFSIREPVGGSKLEEARSAWSAFRSPDPGGIRTDFRSLPFLGAALRRVLEEYPWTTDGRSRLERSIVEAGEVPFAQLFEMTREEPAFLGDTVLKWRAKVLETRAPRWLGGVLIDERCPWRWDPTLGRLTRRSTAGAPDRSALPR